MVRHRGVSLPDIRGLGMPQTVARVIAAGLLVAVPLVSSPQRTIARDGLVRAPDPVSVVADEAVGGPVNVWPSKAESTPTDPVDAQQAVADAVAERVETPGPAAFCRSRHAEAPPSTTIGEYVVRPGDSIYAIAQRIVGSDAAAVSEFARRDRRSQHGPRDARRPAFHQRRLHRRRVGARATGRRRGGRLRHPRRPPRPRRTRTASTSYARASRCGRSQRTSSATRCAGPRSSTRTRVASSTTAGRCTIPT